MSKNHLINADGSSTEMDADSDQLLLDQEKRATIAAKKYQKTINRIQIERDCLIAFIVTAVVGSICLFFLYLLIQPSVNILDSQPLRANITFPTDDDIVRCTKECIVSIMASVRTLYKMGVPIGGSFKMGSTAYVRFDGNETIVDCPVICSARGWIIA